MTVENKKIVKEHPKGEFIIRENDLSDCAYIMESGRAEVCKTLPNGEYQVIGVLEENDIFGELGLIDGLPRSASVRALESCRVSTLTQQAFKSRARNNPQALMPILKILTNRLRETLVLVDELVNN
ncbi:MAG: CRP/FNR family cyclic AMP-dependent transcriptional regulator [Nitrospinales bacterium]|jgi:CRP/FNR family cyclic AMP-dependent transcriptional regulator